MAAVEGGVDPETLRKMNCFYPSYIDATITRPKVSYPWVPAPTLSLFVSRAAGSQPRARCDARCAIQLVTVAQVEHPHIMECVEVFKLFKLPYVLEVPQTTPHNP